MNIEKIKKMLDQIESSNKEKISSLVKDIRDELNQDLIYLKNLLRSNEWPEAVPVFQICDNDSYQDKADRAEGIMEILVDEDLNGKKFLDFGCGEGYCAKYIATREAVISVGYDIVQSGTLVWEEKPSNLLLSTNLEEVKNEGPYDFILMYDVIDHAQNPYQVLKDVKNLLAKNGKVHLRCHPWCGRHGGDLYRQINKAFVHLVFTEEELKDMGYVIPYVNKTLYPFNVYSKYIKYAGFNDAKPEIDIQEVEGFFKSNKIIKNRILNKYKSLEWKVNPPNWQLSQCFLDYILT